MRNKILIIFTLALCFLACSNSNAQLPSQSSSDFYDAVLDDLNSLHSTFVSVDVESDEYAGKAVIENANLFYFLKQTKGFNQSQYKSFMKDLLLKKSKLSLGKSELNKWNFIKVKKVETVENYAGQGKAKLIAHFFNVIKNKDFSVFVVKREISDDETNAVIAKFFDWKIAALTDDETGYLILLLDETIEIER